MRDQKIIDARTFGINAFKDEVTNKTNLDAIDINTVYTRVEDIKQKINELINKYPEDSSNKKNTLNDEITRITGIKTELEKKSKLLNGDKAPGYLQEVKDLENQLKPIKDNKDKYDEIKNYLDANRKKMEDMNKLAIDKKNIHLIIAGEIKTLFQTFDQIYNDYTLTNYDGYKTKYGEIEGRIEDTKQLINGIITSINGVVTEIEDDIKIFTQKEIKSITQSIDTKKKDLANKKNELDTKKIKLAKAIKIDKLPELNIQGIDLTQFNVSQDSMNKLIQYIDNLKTSIEKLELRKTYLQKSIEKKLSVGTYYGNNLDINTLNEDQKILNNTRSSELKRIYNKLIGDVNEKIKEYQDTLSNAREDGSDGITNYKAGLKQQRDLIASKIANIELIKSDASNRQTELQTLEASRQSILDEYNTLTNLQHYNTEVTNIVIKNLTKHSEVESQFNSINNKIVEAEKDIKSANKTLNALNDLNTDNKTYNTQINGLKVLIQKIRNALSTYNTNIEVLVNKAVKLYTAQLETKMKTKKDLVEINYSYIFNEDIKNFNIENKTCGQCKNQLAKLSDKQKQEIKIDDIKLEIDYQYNHYNNTKYQKIKDH